MSTPSSEAVTTASSLPAVLLVNTQARAGSEAFADAAKELTARGLSLLDARAVDVPERFPELLRSSIRSGARLIIIGGGDGTVSTAANALAGTNVALAVLPLGTGNDFARTLEMPDGFEEACAALASGHLAKVDLGRIGGGRYFLNALTVGITADMARRLGPEAKRALGPVAYVAGAAIEAQSTRPFLARMIADGRPYELETMELVVGNGRHMGGGRLISPEARLDDGLLDVYAISAAQDGRWRQVLTLAKVAVKLQLGLHTADREVLHLRVKRVELKTEPVVAVSADGESCGQTPIVAEVVPRALDVLMPGRVEP